jgi:SynChlorMet cassette protein ScmD
MSDDYLIVKDPKVVLREEFDQWGILFNPDTSEVISINAVGIDIWKSIERASSLKDILTVIDAQYDQVPKEAQEQIKSFLEILIKRGFLKHLHEEEKS